LNKNTPFLNTIGGVIIGAVLFSGIFRVEVNLPEWMIVKEKSVNNTNVEAQPQGIQLAAMGMPLMDMTAPITSETPETTETPLTTETPIPTECPAATDIANPTGTADPTGIAGPTDLPEPTESTIPAPTPWKTPEEIAGDIQQVPIGEAVPGDIFFSGDNAYTLLSSGLELPFGASPMDIMATVTEKPDLIKFIKPGETQPGDIFIVDDKAYMLLDGGYSLLYKDPTAHELVETPDLQAANIIIRMRAGDVPDDTPGLADAYAVMRIRPDVETQIEAEAPPNEPNADKTQAPSPTDTPMPEIEFKPTVAPIHTYTQTPHVRINTSTPIPTHTSTPVPIRAATNTPMPAPPPAPVYTPAPTVAIDPPPAGTSTSVTTNTPASAAYEIPTGMPDADEWARRIYNAKLPFTPINITTGMPSADEWAKRIKGAQIP